MKPAAIRCAIYTRKSSEEGLEQNFNSLDAQRESCEAYVLSQAGEGWSVLPTMYDDGGYSGGTMERPGLRRLLADIALRKVDIVVVYKVDRLTRNLADFAKIVDIFDGHGVSFVSVTQAFNTTSSMGRLTLNVLLSFAQFEREVTGERIRDKIAASKRKGMWMGGIPPLGYRAHERTLLVDPAEATVVRDIFDRYLAIGSVNALTRQLSDERIQSRTGTSFTRGALYHLLANRIYVGEIVHKDLSYPGQHQAIIDRAVFDKAAALLKKHRSENGPRAVGAAKAPLTGLLRDRDGRTLTPVTARNRQGRLYRYYVSTHLQLGGRGDGMRLVAPDLEDLVLDAARKAMPEIVDWQSARPRIGGVEVMDECIVVTLMPGRRVTSRALDCFDHAEILGDGKVRLELAYDPRPWGGRSTTNRAGISGRAGPRFDRSLIRGLGRAHKLVNAAKAAPEQSVRAFGQQAGASESYVRRLSRIAFLAPDIQRAILDGRQPATLTLEKLMRMDLPLSWHAQRQALGFTAA